MPKTIAKLLGAASLLTVCLSAHAVDGVTLISQATVDASGGFPYQITKPGSYRLCDNLVVTASHTTAINITASNVSLDLNGFSITGPGSSTGLYGVADAGGDMAISIRNGTIAGFATAVNLNESGSPADSVTGAIIEGLRIDNNQVGINSGAGSLISNNVLTNNSVYGINSGGAATISGNTVVFLEKGNTATGIKTTCPSNLVGNTAVGNGTANYTTPLTIISEACTLSNNEFPAT